MHTEVLIVEDDPQVRHAVRQALGEDAYAFAEAASAREGIDLAAARQPSLIILDLGLPDGSGFRVCREVRQWSSASIVVLSARHSESEKVALLEIGADDYVTKPFSPAEFRARVQAHLRRARMTELPGEAVALRFGDLTIDVAAQVVRHGERSIHLTATEWELLRAFVRNAGRTLTHDQIFTAVWPSSVGNAAQYLRVYVARLRRKLEPDPGRPRVILTESGVGYRFAVPD
jgi:two-component system KDP operon response regulator KdpE